MVRLLPSFLKQVNMNRSHSRWLVSGVGKKNFLKSFSIKNLRRFFVAFSGHRIPVLELILDT